jgi:methyltransferase (TIGR00027 family)
MRAKHPSVTAENIALLRACESRRPADRRICHDPYAVHFIPAWLRPLGAKAALAFGTLSNWDALFPGVGNAILARTHFIDDCLEAALAGDIEQLVLLGAGYDTRPLRFMKAMSGVTVFELDHPATQRQKLERLGRIGATAHRCIRYLPIDLASDAIDEGLSAHGYAPRRKSLLIWEGVTYYLPMVSVRRTFALLAELAAPGSRLVFDYFPPSVADGTNPLPEARALRAGLKHIGEEIRSGLRPEDLAEMMQKNGFELRRNLSCRQYVRRHLAAAHRERRFSELFYFAEAVAA